MGEHLGISEFLAGVGRGREGNRRGRERGRGKVREREGGKESEREIVEYVGRRQERGI